MSADDRSLRVRVEAALRAGLADYAGVADAAALEQARVRHLGRKGAVAELFAALSQVEPAERPQAGKLLNEVKQRLAAAQAEAETRIGAGQARQRHLDATLPGRPRWIGHAHVISQTLDEMKGIFAELGFSVALGPEVELDAYNFEALNFPANHPARDLQDTFYVDDAVLLRTQTSPMQVRVMRSQKPPVRVIVPGRVYRNEAIDASHAAEFYQLEGLYVDRHVSMVDLKATVAHFVRRMFGAGTRVRFKPHFFPFTEPSVDVDMLWEHTGQWLEIMGAGMVHPNVFKASGYDPELVTGFAFGMGVDRIAMLRHGITDIRLLLENDVRFLEQF